MSVEYGIHGENGEDRRAEEGLGRMRKEGRAEEDEDDVEERYAEAREDKRQNGGLHG